MHLKAEFKESSELLTAVRIQNPLLLRSIHAMSHSHKIDNCA